MQHQQFNHHAEHSVVFLHGANAGGWMWDKVIQHLPHLHCISVDFPGHDSARGEPWTTGEAVANQVAQCIAEHGHNGRAHVVGLSLGGYIALHLLAHKPDLVGAVMISGVPSKPIPHRWAIRALGTLMAPFIHSDILLRMSAKSLHVPAEEMARFIERSKRNTKQAFRRINQQAVAFLPPPAALQTSNRKLFIAGSREHPVIRSSLSDFAQARASSCAMAEGLGHGWSAENPQLFAATLTRWIDEAPLPDALIPVG